MLFNSVTYLVFLTLVISLYYMLPKKPRLLLIFISSLVFYGFWRIEFIPVMMLSVITDYIVSIRISNTDKINKKKFYLFISIFVNLGLLFYFKYLIFFAENAIGLMHLVGLEVDKFALNIILPLGISFYTFQTISYTVDVYRGFIKPEEDFILYGCYVIFFPQLVAGPILRAVEIIPQFKNNSKLNLVNIAIGIKRILYGLFLKVVIADNIAPLVDSGFALPLNSISALDVWSLAFLFGFQIYFDFSAYSHIAIGSACLLGIHLPENFSFPYLATSPKDFWKKWHITLSSWIRDYLYLPLARVRVHDRSTGGLEEAVSYQTNQKKRRKTISLYITWAIMGLWHGANYTFILWGLSHAIFIFCYRYTASFLKDIPEILRKFGGWAVTLLFVMLAWIPFRAQSVSNALEMYNKLLNVNDYLWTGMRENTHLVNFLLLIGILITFFIKEYFIPVIRKYHIVYISLESFLLCVIISLDFIFLRPIEQFIYFQF